MTRRAWQLRHLDDLLVVAAAGAAFGANVVGLWIGVGIGWVLAAAALLLVTLLIVQHARAQRERLRPWLIELRVIRSEYEARLRHVPALWIASVDLAPPAASRDEVGIAVPVDATTRDDAERIARACCEVAGVTVLASRVRP